MLLVWGAIEVSRRGGYPIWLETATLCLVKLNINFGWTIPLRVNFKFTFQQQCLDLRYTAAPTGPEKKSQWRKNSWVYTYRIGYSEEHKYTSLFIKV